MSTRYARFSRQGGGRIAAAPPEAVAAALRTQAQSLGRVLSINDSRIAASARAEGAIILSQRPSVLHAFSML